VRGKEIAGESEGERNSRGSEGESKREVAEQTELSEQNEGERECKRDGDMKREHIGTDHQHRQRKTDMSAQSNRTHAHTPGFPLAGNSWLSADKLIKLPLANCPEEEKHPTEK
jgi:hypothetical protein